MTHTIHGIALDLETTGLNPHEDTIIEIAAVRFTLKYQENQWTLQDVTERSMLINPGFPLSEEVSLITGITDNILSGRATWQEIRSKVADFFSDAPMIVGHNVFFDIDMLKTHDIDLSHLSIIDTFELAQILSPEAKSLNLGFLGDHYDIKKRGPEHRALTDVWMSIDLLVIYLEKLKHLGGYEYYIWKRMSIRDTSGSLKLLPCNSRETPFTEDMYTRYHQSLTAKKDNQSLQQHTCSQPHNITLYNLSGRRDEEGLLLQSILQEYPKIELIVRNQNIAQYIIAQLSLQANITAFQVFPPEAFISPQAVYDAITSQELLERKEVIFLIRLGFWLHRTKTGLVNELKWYGLEYTYIPLFVTLPDEWHTFRLAHHTKMQETSCLIRDISHSLPANNLPVIVRDIALIEGVIRSTLSTHIHIESIIEDIIQIGGTFASILIESVRIFEGMLLNTSDRPTGEHFYPPGKHGEIYCISQQTLWNRGGIWIALANKKLHTCLYQWNAFCTQSNLSRKQYIRYIRTKNALLTLAAFIQKKVGSQSLIIKIHQESMHLQILPTIIPENIYKQWKYGYGYGISAQQTLTFLSKEIQVPFQLETYSSCPQHTAYAYPEKALPQGKTLILTTSMRHIRELGEYYDSYQPILQGTSGGRAKMQHYFLSKEGISVMIGLIDTWKDMFDILKNTDKLVIAKIPFDPPTDPYFMAKTQGMSNNFEQYSKPITLSKLNTLIGNYLSTKPDGNILCTDPRINTSEWGKFLKKHLL